MRTRENNTRARRHRITIQSAVTESGNYGQKKITSWANVTGLTNVHAHFHFTSGGETFRGRQVEAEVVGVFEVRIQPTAITPLHRLVHVSGGNKAYGITAALPVEGSTDGALREMLIYVKAIADG